MIGSFSKKYQSVNNQSWEMMTDEEVRYIWRYNIAGGSILAHLVGIGIFVAFTVTTLMTGYKEVDEVFGPFLWPLVIWLVVSDIQDRGKRKRMTRTDMIEEIEITRAIRREASPI